MNITKAIAVLSKKAPKPELGLPQELFYYISKTTPLVNVDLLIKDERGRILLAWRDDEHCGKGWHVPGGIVRFKETIEARIKKVAKTEIGTSISFEKVPLAIIQLIHPELKVRSHFISILYKCFVSGKFVPKNEGLSEKDPGYLKWHDNCPKNILKFHKLYRKYM
ncbi:MAG: NUDIX domain-containing protein [Candidatus Omnitrophota bacterium]